MSALNTFLGDSILKYRSRHIEFIPTPKITIGSITCTGEATKEKLRIATGSHQNDWLPVFIHETCHLDQDSENPTWFQECEEAHQTLEQWLAGKIELDNPRQVSAQVIALEHDCERRSLEKISSYRLPVDLREYAQKANAYLLSYHLTVADRNWESAPYNDQTIWSKMPSKLLSLPEVQNPSTAHIAIFRPEINTSTTGAKAWWIKSSCAKKA
jgi:hypothetical protein